LAKYSQFYSIMSAIKRTFSRSPTHREALNNAKCPRKKGPRGGARYRCIQCKKDFGIRQVNVDHVNPIVPIGTLSKDMSWDYLVQNIFCDVENLQVLCEKCHKAKSAIENKERKRVKDELKTSQYSNVTCICYRDREVGPDYNCTLCDGTGQEKL
jgi:5-methylcytosine-specific restriction endonuclease McrA